ncbi:MAG: PAS domain S-box protein [Acidobacteriia bacterium]|nr:PAS domain S-box protein [Terriglobia bacterium]
MTQSAKPQHDFSFAASIPEGAVPLESILCTEELRRRPSRPPDYEKENRALMALAATLADPTSNIFQRFAEIILEATQCGSSGLSLLTREDGGKRFYWPAIAGMWKPHIGAGTPRNFGPCGDVLDRNCTLLFRHFERRYPYFLPVTPLIDECLLVPFYVDGKAVGTIWAIMHTDRRRFDAEDERLMNTLGQFASLAYQTVDSIEGLRAQITARESAEAELRRLANGLEAKVRRLVDANVIGIVIWNVEGAITEANEAFLQMVQYGREDLVSGRVHWMDLTPAEWRDRDERAIAELKATGIFQPFEKEYRRKDGSRVSVLIGGAFFEGSGDEGVAFILDLSEQKRAAKVLRQTQEDLTRTQSEFAHVNRVMTMGELTASIAHEVNQPLTSIVSSGDSCLAWLANEPPNLEKARASANRMVQAATRASEIVQGIRATFKKSTPTTASVDLNGVIEETIPFVHGEAQRKNVSLRAELHAGITSVNGDRVQLQQVLLNLMMNGIEAMAGLDTEPKRLLIRSAVPNPSELLVSIADTGPGIDPELASRLFTPFFTTKPQGIGMGLRISRSIIEAHGGRLWAEQNEPRGAVFHFNLPSATASE